MYIMFRLMEIPCLYLLICIYVLFTFIWHVYIPIFFNGTSLFLSSFLNYFCLLVILELFDCLFIWFLARDIFYLCRKERLPFLPSFPLFFGELLLHMNRLQWHPYSLDCYFFYCLSFFKRHIFCVSSVNSIWYLSLRPTVLW